MNESSLAALEQVVEDHPFSTNPLLDLSLFFLKQSPSSSRPRQDPGDLFDCPLEWLAKISSRLVYQWKKVFASQSIFVPHPKWEKRLGEDDLSPRTAFLHRQMKKFLIVICGSGEECRQLKDFHLLLTNLHEIRRLTSSTSENSKSYFVSPWICWTTAINRIIRTANGSWARQFTWGILGRQMWRSMCPFRSWRRIGWTRSVSLSFLWMLKIVSIWFSLHSATRKFGRTNRKTSKQILCWRFVILLGRMFCLSVWRTLRWSMKFSSRLVRRFVLIVEVQVKICQLIGLLPDEHRMEWLVAKMKTKRIEKKSFIECWIAWFGHSIDITSRERLIDTQWRTIASLSQQFTCCLSLFNQCFLHVLSVA